MTCTQCNNELRSLIKEEYDNTIENYDCKSSFVNMHSYFSANVIRCVGCDKYYLLGYYEDLDNSNIEDEFGKRYWIEREIKKSDFDIIKENVNKYCLDLTSFGNL
jgi:hypothetical protein